MLAWEMPIFSFKIRLPKPVSPVPVVIDLRVKKKKNNNMVGRELPEFYI